MHYRLSLPLLVLLPLTTAQNIAVGGGAAPAQTTVATQMPTTTQVQYPQTLANGEVTWVGTMFTQTFVSVPDQWPGPASGQIGLGNIAGTIGAVKTGTPS
jgi:hypothetical protein